MKLSTIALSACLALGTAAAHADVPLDLSSGSTGFFSTPASGGFVDTYTFTLVTPSLTTGSVTSSAIGAQDVDFLSVFLTGPSGAYSFTQLLADPLPETWGLTPVALAAGSYVLTIIGTNSAAAASYGGNLAITVIPEPESAALLLAGLVAMGFIARRRSA